MDHLQALQPPWSPATAQEVCPALGCGEIPPVLYAPVCLSFTPAQPCWPLALDVIPVTGVFDGARFMVVIPAKSQLRLHLSAQRQQVRSSCEYGCECRGKKKILSVMQLLEENEPKGSRQVYLKVNYAKPN